MSVTVRYSGSLQDIASLSSLQEEFSDIARTHAWPQEQVEGAFAGVESINRGGRTGLLAPPLMLKGLRLVVHPQTDPLWLSFAPNGELTRMSFYSVDAPGATRRYEFLHQAQASIQTSIGGSRLHRTVIRLLDRLKWQYMPDLQVQDDSGYYLDRDEAKLSRVMNGA